MCGSAESESRYNMGPRLVLVSPFSKEIQIVTTQSGICPIYASLSKMRGDEGKTKCERGPDNKKQQQKRKHGRINLAQVNPIWL